MLMRTNTLKSVCSLNGRCRAESACNSKHDANKAAETTRSCQMRESSAKSSARQFSLFPTAAVQIRDSLGPFPRHKRKTSLLLHQLASSFRGFFELPCVW